MSNASPNRLPRRARKNVGVNAHRLTREPEEARFAAAWEKSNEEGKTLAYLLHAGDQGGSNRPVDPTDREREIAATVIQWLGSSVGQFFLASVGYTKPEFFLASVGYTKPDGKK